MSINSFIAAISGAGGMSMTNGYEIEFYLPDKLKTYLTPYAGNPVGNSGVKDKGFLVKYLCDEAQLPNVQIATGTYSGRYTGQAQVNYAHTKTYSDLSLGWMLDANATPLKFLTAWNSYIFSAGDNDLPKPLSNNRIDTVQLETPLVYNRGIRVKYPADYQATKIVITKTEKGKNSPNGRAPISYILEEAFPYSIDSVPLSYGTSQISRVTANFYYARHTVVFNEIAGFSG